MVKKYIDYYELLNLQKYAPENRESPISEKEFDEARKKAFRNSANKTHPDKGGNEEDFKLVNEANSVLSDHNKRNQYDKARIDYLKRKKEKEAAAQKATTEQTIYKQPNREETSSTVEETNIAEETKQEDIIDTIIKTYKEVREEEKKGPNIFARYNARDKILSKYNLSIFSPFFNVIGEMANQMLKLKRKPDEDITKYTIRNRFNLAAAAVILTFSLGTSSKPKEEEIVETPIIDVAEEEEKTVLYNYHIVEEGDTLSGLAQRGHISLEELKEVNGIDRDTIYLGEELIIPFALTDDILEYYTETKEVNNTSLEEIANQYETDICSLKILNGEAITEDNIILSNELIIPKFLTENEWAHIKNNAKSYSKVNKN